MAPPPTLRGSFVCFFATLKKESVRRAYMDIMINDCVDRWLMENGVCPVCKTPVGVG